MLRFLFIFGRTIMGGGGVKTNSLIEIRVKSILMYFIV
jgi:hypothetical protein